MRGTALARNVLRRLLQAVPVILGIVVLNFLLLQLAMVALVIAFPALVTGGLDKPVKVDMKAVEQQMLQDLNETDQSSDFNTLIVPGDNAAAGAGAGAKPTLPANGGLPEADSGAGESSFGPVGGEAEDPMKAIQDSIGK